MVNGEAHKMTILLSNRYESELEMAQSAAQGDDNAKRDLVGLVLDQVRRTMSYLSGSERDAEDLSQMALIQILNSAGSFRGECTLKYWAERIAVRTAMKHFRKRQRREKLTVSWFTAAPEHSDDDIELASDSDSEEDVKPKSKVSKKSSKKVVESDSDSDSESEEEPVKKTSKGPSKVSNSKSKKSSKKVVESDSEDEPSNDSESEEKPVNSKSKASKKSSKKVVESESDSDSESDVDIEVSDSEEEPLDISSDSDSD